MKSFFQRDNCHMPPLRSNVLLVTLIQMNKFWTEELLLKFLMKRGNYILFFFFFKFFPFILKSVSYKKVRNQYVYHLFFFF